MLLRDHQERAIEGVERSIAQGRCRPIIVMPCGSGKTVTSAALSRRYPRSLFIVHREELLAQMVDTHRAMFKHDVGVIAASSKEDQRLDAPVLVGSIQTLVSRQIYPDVDLVVPDEAHHMMADEWLAYLQRYSTKPVVGLTATPSRGDGKALSFFNNLIVPTSVKELTELGVLVPAEIIRPGKILEPGKIATSPVKAYLAHAAGKRTICFAANTKAAEAYLAEFRAAGVTAEFVSYKTPNRAEVMAAYKAGKISVLINLYVATEGFDDKPTECMILARHVGNAGLYVQMIGRPLRASPGKTSAIILDLTGTSHIYGPPDQEYAYSLDGKAMRPKGEVVTERFCSVCGAYIQWDSRICLDCGAERAEMKVPAVTNDPIAKFQAVRQRTPEEKRAHYFRLLKECQRKSWHPGRAYHIYKATYGTPPDPKWKL